MQEFYVGDFCDNIGLVLACLPRGSTNASASPSQYMTQPSGIPILSPVPFMHVGDPANIPPYKFEEFLRSVCGVQSVLETHVQYTCICEHQSCT